MADVAALVGWFGGDLDDGKAPSWCPGLTAASCSRGSRSSPPGSPPPSPPATSRRWAAAPCSRRTRSAALAWACPFFTAALSQVCPHETGSAAGPLNTVQQLGATLGVGGSVGATGVVVGGGAGYVAVTTGGRGSSRAS